MTLTPEQLKEVNRAAIIDGLTARLTEVEGDLASLRTAHALKCRSVTSLEAEVVRLRMTRTDDQARAEVDRLRAEIGRKDREACHLKTALANAEDRERKSLLRALQAERRADERSESFRATVDAMQSARASAQEKAAVAEGDRVEAVKTMVLASDRAKQAEAKAAGLGKIQEQALRALRALPASIRRQREVRVLAAMLKEPDPVDGKNG